MYYFPKYPEQLQVYNNIMTFILPTLNNVHNEIVFGLAGGLGVNFDDVADKLAKNLSKAGYHVVNLKIADNFVKRDNPSKFAECYWKMQYGTEQRRHYGNDFWTKQVVAKIFDGRPELSKKYSKIAYIVRSLKNKDELELLSTVYGRNFIGISVFSEIEASLQYLKQKLKIGRLTIKHAEEQMYEINSELKLAQDIRVREAADLHLDDFTAVPDGSEADLLLRFLIRKDQEETHPQLKKNGQNLFQCYSLSNFFIYQNNSLERQVARFTNLLFNDPFAEPTYEEYFMFCAQAAAYRSLDLDRQVGAVIVNSEQELVASGFNDVCKVGGGNFIHHDHPMREVQDASVDYRDFKLQVDYNHKYLDQIAQSLAVKLSLSSDEQMTLREEIRGITEFKRSTHAEMSALLDASRRGVAVRDCTIYVNTYPCHNCTKHIIASGIRKIVFLHPYTKSKAREMFKGMIKHGLVTGNDLPNLLVFEPFLGVSPNRFIQTFANDKETRLEKEDGRETGKIMHWQINYDSVPRELRERQPHSYISREWAVINDKLPDMSAFYTK